MSACPQLRDCSGQLQGSKFRGKKGKLTVLKMQNPDEAVTYFPGEAKISTGCKKALQITMNIWSYNSEWFWKEKRNVICGKTSSKKCSIRPLPKHPGEGFWDGGSWVMLIFSTLVMLIFSLFLFFLGVWDRLQTPEDLQTYFAGGRMFIKYFHLELPFKSFPLFAQD